MMLNNLLENLEMNLDMVRRRSVIRVLSRNKDEEEGEEKDRAGTVKMRNYFDEFCQNTSIHGMKYLTQKKRRLIGKMWWGIIIIVCFILCSTFIRRAYLKWQSSPIIVTFATEQTLISEIPFPAVTICPSAKVARKVFNFTDIVLRGENNETLSDEEKKHFDYMSLVCDTSWHSFENRMFNEDAIVFLDKASLDVKNVTVWAIWEGNFKSTDYFLSKVLTSDGFCYTFNILNPNDIFTKEARHFNGETKSSKWSLNDGYDNEDRSPVYPRRAHAVGSNGGLTILLSMMNEDVDYLCGMALQGFKIGIHNPAEIPDMAEQYFLAPLDQAIVGVIKPNMMQTHESLRYYDYNARKCYFRGERNLKYFKAYNQKNCLLECRANFTLVWCGCVAFYMPHERNTPICGQGTTRCVQVVQAAYLHHDFSDKIQDENFTMYTNYSNGTPLDTAGCNCYPSCRSLDYEVQTSQSEWNWKELFETLAKTKRFANMVDTDIVETGHFSMLSLFYKDMQFMTSERNELYGKGQLLANWGGLLGLFMGFSVISMFEVLYFLMMRWAGYMWLYGKRSWIVLLTLLFAVVLIFFIGFLLTVTVMALSDH